MQMYRVAIKRSFYTIIPNSFQIKGWDGKKTRANWEDGEERGERRERRLDVSSNQRKPAGGTERVGGVKEEHH